MLSIHHAPDRVLAYPWWCVVYRFRLYGRWWCRHGHPLGGTFLFTGLVVLILVAALLSVVVTTRRSAALVGLAFLSPLSLDDVLEESVS